MHSLKDKVCLVTGGAGGIGVAIVEELLKEGVKHVAVLDINEAAGVALEKEANNKYGEGKIHFYKCDVTKDEELFVVYNSTMENFGIIDLVVNNAGIANDSPDVYKKEINVNFTATVASTLKALEIMRVDEGGKGGTIINISSIAALKLRWPQMFVYSATKSAIFHFSNTIGNEEYYRHTNVRVLTVCFGVTSTEILTDMKCVDKISYEAIANIVDYYKKKEIVQSAEAAAKGLVTSYKNGNPGSTWVVDFNKTLDISKDVTEGYKIMSTNLSLR